MEKLFASSRYYDKLLDNQSDLYVAYVILHIALQSLWLC